MNNRFVVVILALVFILPIALGDVALNRQMPNAVQVENTINISLDFRSTKNIDAFDVVEFVPLGWEVSAWSVSNYDKDSVALESIPSYTYQGKARTAYHWNFRGGLSNEQVLLVYTLKAKETGSNEFITVWTYPGGFNTNTTIMSVLPGEGVIFCGNGVCELGESSFNCLEDCPQIAVQIYDITTILIILAIGAVVAILIYIYYKYLKKVLKRRSTIEDLTIYLKLGLKRGYKLREMINALEGEGIETKMLEKLAKDENIKNLETGGAKVYPESEIIQKIKGVVENLSEKEKKSVYDELKIKKI